MLFPLQQKFGIEYLLKQGADPNLAGASWSTRIERAIKKGHSKIERILKSCAK
jgi:hypothetical protein